MKKIIIGFILSVITVSPSFAQEYGTPEEAVILVNKAIVYIRENGDAAAYAEINKPDGKLRYKDLYLFVTQYDGLMLAHGANPSLVGKNVYYFNDFGGQPVTELFGKTAKSKEGEGWVDYKWPNPITKKIGEKKAYIKKLDDRRFIGCGIYK